MVVRRKPCDTFSDGSELNKPVDAVSGSSKPVRRGNAHKRPLVKSKLSLKTAVLVDK